MEKVETDGSLDSFCSDLQKEEIPLGAASRALRKLSERNKTGDSHTGRIMRAFILLNMQKIFHRVGLSQNLITS